MKFGETFTEYLHGEQECFLEKCSHIEYKQLKKVLKSCRTCREITQDSSCDVITNREEDDNGGSSELCICESCPCMSLFSF